MEDVNIFATPQKMIEGFMEMPFIVFANALETPREEEGTTVVDVTVLVRLSILRRLRAVIQPTYRIQQQNLLRNWLRVRLPEEVQSDVILIA